MTCEEAGQIGAAKRRYLERERICEEARNMRRAMGLSPDPRLYPTLILTRADRLRP